MGNPSDNAADQGPVVAIDGPVASGKSTVGRAVAEQLGLRFLDTGIMYRAVTWLALSVREDLNDAKVMGRLAEQCDMSLDGDNSASLITVNRRQLYSSDLASDEVDRNVSAVAASSAVRRALVAQQRSIAAAGAIVMVGRDIGSVVLPDAHVKLYVDAPPAVRARRRFLQQKERETDADYQRALAETLQRDRLDSERADSPLTIPDGRHSHKHRAHEFVGNGRHRHIGDSGRDDRRRSTRDTREIGNWPGCTNPAGVSDRRFGL